MGRRREISIEEAAHILQKNPDYIRWCLQQGRVDYGDAAQNPITGRWSYNIIPHKFCVYLGITIEELKEQVLEIRVKKRGGENAMSA